MQVLKAAREAKPDAPAGLLGAAINFDGPAVYIEYQIQQIATEAPDCFVVSGCDSAPEKDLLKEIIKRNEKRMVLGSFRSTTGQLVMDEEKSERGFDIPVVVLGDEGNIDEVF